MPVSYRNKNGEKLVAVNIRATEKMKYALTLAARAQEKSLSSYVIDCLQENLKGDQSGLMVKTDESETERYLPDLVWHILDSHRIPNLGMYAPHLLDNTEQLIWTVIQENTRLYQNGKPNYSLIRDNWKKILKEAEDLRESKK